MANLNSLPDLSTVDIQAIQDSGLIIPRTSLPPLTTIAENWDSIEPTDRHLEENEDSCSDGDEDDSDEEEDQSHPNSPRKVQQRISFVKNCSRSSSSAPGTISDCSDSDLSDATSDSGESSSSSSDSDSDSQSSISSCSSKSNYPNHNINQDHPSFSVREANFDKGRVTLRLSSLHPNRKQNNNDLTELESSPKPDITLLSKKRTSDIKSQSPVTQESSSHQLRAVDNRVTLSYRRLKIIFFIIFFFFCY